VLLLTVALSGHCPAPTWGQSPAGTINTVIGGNNGDGQAATNAILDPVGIEAHGQPVSHLYISDSANNRIRRVDGVTGIITTVAGTGQSGFSGDGGPALNAKLGSPRDVTFDSAGNMYIAEQFNRRVRRVDLAGNIQTVAGNGGFSYRGDNVPATQTAVDPYSITVDSNNNLYIADFGNHRVRKVSPQGIITTVAGTGVSGYSGDDGPASQAALASPSDVWVDSNNNLYICDYISSVIRKVDPSGIIDTVVGNGLRGFSGDGGLATQARLNLPYSITGDAIANLMIVDNGNYRVRRVDAPTQFIDTIGGNGTFTTSGDGGPATSAGISSPVGVAVDSVGNVYVSSHVASSDAWSMEDRVRKITPSGIISTVAGISNNGDGGSASNAIVDPYGIRFGKGAFANNLYLTDRRNNQIRKVSGGTGLITTIAGNGGSGFSGDNGLAINATFGAPRGVATDAAGNVWIADTDNNRVRKIDTGGVIRTVAGNGNLGYSGDGVSATATSLYFPYAVDIDAVGNLYIADRFNNRIRKVTPQGIISTIAGNGTAASTGNDGPASQASVASPTDVLVASDGSIYIVETSTHQVRKIRPDGIIVRVAGTGAPGYLGDQGPALNARLNAPWVIALDGDGNLYIGEQGNLRVRRVDAATGIITTVAGTGTAGTLGDGGLATEAQLLAPTGLAADPSNNVLIAQAGSFSVRRVVFDSVPDTPTLPPTATATPTHTPVNTATFTWTHTPTRTRTPSPTFTPIPTNTFTRTPTFTRSFTPTSTFTPTASPPPTSTPTATSSTTPTPTRTLSPTPSSTATPSTTATRTFTRTQTSTRTQSFTPTASRSWTPSRTRTPSRTATPSRTVTPSFTRTFTRTWTATRSQTPTRTALLTHTPTAIQSATPTRTDPPVVTATGTPLPTATRTSSATFTRTTSSPTPTTTSASVFTSTRSATPTATRSRTPTRTFTRSPTPTRTFSPTRTATTGFSTATHTPPRTVTATASRTFTRSYTPTKTFTPTHTMLPPQETATATRTGTPTHTVPIASPSPTATQTASPSASATPVTPAAGPGAISGQIRQALNANLVPSANVTLEFAAGGQASLTQTTAGGLYSFRSIAEQAWTIEPSLFGDLDGSVNEMDAATILAAAAGEITLGREQLVAGDVSGDGSVSEVDASLILQHATEMAATFPVAIACNSDWVFFPDPGEPPAFGLQTVTQPDARAERCVPGSITLDPLIGQVGDRDFLAVAFGDVDNSWVSARAGEGAQDEAVTLGRPLLRGSLALVPIEIESRLPFRALHLVLAYDPEELAFVAIRPGPDGREALVVANDMESGRIVVGAASATLIEAARPFTLEFDVIRPGRYPDVEIVESRMGPF